MPRGLAALAGGLTALVVATTPGDGAAQELCDRIEVPSLLELGCTVETTDGVSRAVVEPLGGAFRLLSRMTLRRLDPEMDGLAWDDPERWLERQMILDLDSVAAVVRDFGHDPDSPLAGGVLQGALDLLVEGIEGLSRLPLSACDGPSDDELVCRFGVQPVSLNLKISLVAADDDRYAFNMRTFNDQRLRHFEAIANSFAAP